MRKLVKLGALLGIVVAVGLMSTTIPNLAYADSNDVKERRALMKSNSKILKGVFGYLKGKGGSPETVAGNARVLAANATKIATLFAPNTGRDKLGSKATRAKPDIWQDRAKFDGIAANMVKLAKALEAAARSGDKKKIGAAAGAIGGQGCKACHKAFRGPKHKG
jgi:cytochrome c556